MRARPATLAAVVGLMAGVPATAVAFWSAGGGGIASAELATLPAGVQPAVDGDARAITVSWDQSSFGGDPLGSLAGGGYTVRRRPVTGGPGQSVGGTCAGTVDGSAPVLSCVDADAPFGAWQYEVTPVLGGWTGAPGPLSSVVVSRLATPMLIAANAQNPGVGEDTGPIALSWEPVAGAASYRVFRRTAGGTYDYDAPIGDPVTATSYTDPGVLAGGGYRYVVRALAAGGEGESLDSNEVSATPIGRPVAPAAPTGVAEVAGRIALDWPDVTGAAGYNVYRRTATGSYDLSAPRNGATPVTVSSFADTATTSGVTYRYVVRTVTTGAGGAGVQSASSPESAPVTADAQAPDAPLTVAVSAAAGPALAAASCGLVAGTRFVNAAGRAAVPVTVTVAAPEPGQRLLLTATTPGSTPVTASIAAGATTITTRLDLSTLLDGTLSLGARSADAAGNASATTSPAIPLVQDTASALGSLAVTDGTGPEKLSGASECGAAITAVETVGPRVGRGFGPLTVGAGGSFSGLSVENVRGNAAGVPWAYDVTANDLAGNVVTVPISGLAYR